MLTYGHKKKEATQTYVASQSTTSCTSLGARRWQANFQLL